MDEDLRQGGADTAPATVPATVLATVLDRLDGHVRERPGKPFLVLCRAERFEVWTFADLAARTERWARRLATLDGRGERRAVFLVASHGIDAYAGFLGAMRAGLVPSFQPPPTVRQRTESYAEAQRRTIAHIRPLAVLTPRAFAEPVALAADGLAPMVVAEDAGALGGADLPPPPTPDATALIQHSSGTTGLKKGVAFSFVQVDAHVAMLAEAIALTPRDTVASWLPLYHDMGLMTGFLAPLSVGASVVALDPFSWVAEPASWLRAIERFRATLAWTPNFGLAHLTRTRTPGERFDLSSLRMLVNCSEPCRPATVAAFARAFAEDGITPERIGACYGMAETVFAATQTTPGAPPRPLTLDAAALEEARIAAPSPNASNRGVRKRTLASCGSPLPGVELRIDALPGFVGEILVRSPTAVDRYVGADAPDPAVDVDGWRRSGDVGLLDGGELYVCGRIKETIVVRGRNLYAGDLEAAVGAIAGVRPGRVAVVALDDAAAGSETLGVLVESAEPDLGPAARAAIERAVRAAVREGFDAPVGEVAIGPPGWLAKSTAGKVSRAENLARLRELRPAAELDAQELAEDDDPGVVRLPLHTLVETVARALADCFGADPARIHAATGPDDVAGWDSLGHTVLLLRLERATGLRLDEAAAGARTAGELAARLAAASALQRRAA